MAGLVMGGGIRDRAAIVARGFPVWSAAVCMRATVKRTARYVNHSAVVGGVLVHPGDLVLGDDDGVVVVAHDRLPDVLERAQAKEASETEIMSKLQAGALTIDLLGFRETLRELGVNP